MSAAERYLTADDIAARLGVSRATACAFIREMKHLRVRSMLRVDEQEFGRWASRRAGMHAKPGPKQFNRPSGRGGWIYFIQCGDDGPIKVGFALDAEKRLGQLQVGNHHDLRIVAKIASERFRHESEIQHELRDAHIRGEWYEADAVVALLERLPTPVTE
jgi:hypothetical protein